MATGPRLVNKQFNSPIGLYSQKNIQDTLSKQTQVLGNGVVGIDFNNPVNSKPANLANSAVLRMLEEEEQRQRNGQNRETDSWERTSDSRVRRIDRLIDWPPKPRVDNNHVNMNCSYSAKFFTPRTSGAKRVAWPPPPEEADQAQEQEQLQGSGVPQGASVRAPAYRQAVEPPPTTITLLATAPVHQAPPPVYSSQPVANTFKGGVNMRGDQKWPPQSVKEAVEAENEARVQLAKGPACRPRKVRKDYSRFFAQNALPHNYPGYRAPPGTQHFDDPSGISQY